MKYDFIKNCSTAWMTKMSTELDVFLAWAVPEHDDADEAG
jgi:hypothetical protein